VRKEVLRKVEDRHILQAIKREANWIGHILRGNCLLKHVIEGKLVFLCRPMYEAPPFTMNNRYLTNNF
jgi:hypothetical protein